MPSFSKGKRKLRDMRCVLFPDHPVGSFSRRRLSEPSKATKSWERCGESFQDSDVVQKLQATGKSGRSVQRLVQSSTPVRAGPGEDEPVHIAWSSSEEEQSDAEMQSQHPLPSTQTSQPCRPQRTQTDVSFSNKYLTMLSAGADTDELPTIDSESEHEEESSVSKEDISHAMGEISDYYSSDGEGASEESSRLSSSTVDPSESRQRSVSEWVRNAQALLQTPRKQMDRSSKTPEDSGKKRRKFESGGLAERLNRLQCRQRSAVSFWRHQSSTTTPTEVRPGVLVLCVRSVWEVCGMRAALCDRAAEREPCVALFSRETAAQLGPAAGDTVHVYPPWQNLVVEGERHPIILSTHFSQKVLAKEAQTSDVNSPNVPFVKKTRPYPLTKCLWQSMKSLTPSSLSSGPDEPAKADPGGTFDSILEAVEACGPSGSVCGPVEVVVQRVYFCPVTQTPSTTSIRNKTVSRSLRSSAQHQHIARFCMLVQDACGMFSEVQLQCASTEEELKHSAELLQGRACVLQALNVTQRLTRDRSTHLFSLIDSLWPPLLPPRVYGGASSCCQTSRVQAPGFCYKLTGHQDCVIPQHVSPLYHPPLFQSLSEILQDESMSRLCCFTATVVYKRDQSVGGKDLLLFVTDSSLQTEQSAGSFSRTLPVYVSPSCLLQPSVSQALASHQPRPTLSFRDAVLEQRQIFCWGQTVVQLDTEATLNPDLSLPQSVLLDQLGLQSPPCSLCTLTGVVTGVDEASAFSWPTCCHCGSESLEPVPNNQTAFLCVSCGVVEKPTTKMQLEVFLGSSTLSRCTIKVKLQQNSITALLNSTGCAEGYEVEKVLGKKVGPLNAFIHVINRRSTLWMGLEEITL